jgi:hypothetical protein
MVRVDIINFAQFSGFPPTLMEKKKYERHKYPATSGRKSSTSCPGKVEESGGRRDPERV